MRHLLSRVVRKLVVIAILLAVAAGLLWWQRAPLLSWYYVRGLASADDGERPMWVDRVAGLDVAALPRLIDLLRQEDARACANGEAALSELAKRWGPRDPRAQALAEVLPGKFGSFSTPGREAALEWYLALLHEMDNQKATSRPLADSAAIVLVVAAKVQEKGVRVRTMALAGALLARGAAVNVDLCRDLATGGLASDNAEIRAQAVRLVMQAPLQAEKKLLDSVVPFLQDAAPEVRRAAVLAVGLAEETVSIQEMLPLLQDSDAEVRRLCEGALRVRGLQDTHIKLAKLITDHRAGQRLQVVHFLNEVEDLDPGIWLTHLSQDTSPAVRAAAIRFAAEDPAAVDFEQRMRQMSRDDASMTVRQLAAYYLKNYQKR